jgi:5'-deoxynucleotidase YfbR-like HD superfamily hydrolase
VDNSGWIQTYTGKKFYPLNPTTESIDVIDIAHSLSLTCRFGGHCLCFYSVAQHSVLVSQNCDERDALWGLLHDAAEAYLCDLPRPIKHELRRQSGGSESFFDHFESRLMSAICAKFGLSEKQPLSVHKADAALLTTEARDLMAPCTSEWQSNIENSHLALSKKIIPQSCDQAEVEFLRRFRKLTEEPR